MKILGSTEIEVEGMGRAIVPRGAFDEYYGIRINWRSRSDIFSPVYAFIKLIGEVDRSNIALIEYKRPLSLKIYWKYTIPPKWQSKRYMISSVIKNDKPFTYTFRFELVHIVSKSTKDPARLIKPKQRYQILKRQKWKCNTCACKLKFSKDSDWDGEIAHIDHIHPFALRHTYPRGQAKINELSNLQALCPDCNLSKGTNIQ